LKKPQMLPPTELQVAILALIDAAHGVASDELPNAVARLIGFKSTSAQLKAVLQKEQERLIKSGALEALDGFLKRSGKNQSSRSL
jgi:hypothetical protein